MQPRLIAVSGPLEGQTFPLDAELSADEPFRIGRQPDNHLQVPSLEVSRHHCELIAEAPGRWRVRDLDSRHGVFVNGRPVGEQVLAHSDQLTLGSHAFLFLLDDPTPGTTPGTAPGTRTQGPSPWTAASTLLRNPTDLLYLDPGRVEGVAPQPASGPDPRGRLARDLHTLLRASRSLQGPRDVDEVARGLAEAVAGALPAEGLAVVVLEAGEEPGSASQVRACIPDDLELPDLGALAQRVCGRGPVAGEPGDLVAPDRPDLDGQGADRAGPTGLLLSGFEASSDGGGEMKLEAESEGGRRRDRRAIRSLVAAPLLDSDQRPLGLVLGVDRGDDAFDERHLDLLVALAGIGSLALRNALHLRWLRRENARLRDDHLAHDLVGESPAIKRVLGLVAKVARVETTVLVRGESGTGKELVARAIHRSGARAEGPFLAINCASLSATLLESELFGHERGAFTGAVARQVGKLEAAAGGTLFLDEVGEIPVELQAKLLRVLQERQFVRVGGAQPIAADIRVLAATNRDLEAMIREGLFREDLYYRLNVIAIELPPLRERRDDVPLLSAHLAARHADRLGRRRVGIDPATRRCLVAYDWPGNVRELSNALERALVLGDDEVIRPEDLPDEVAAAGVESGAATGVESAAAASLRPGGLQASVTAFKRRLLLDAWEQAGRDYGATAELLGIHVNSLHRMVRILGLKGDLGR